MSNFLCKSYRMALLICGLGCSLQAAFLPSAATRQAVMQPGGAACRLAAIQSGIHLSVRQAEEHAARIRKEMRKTGIVPDIMPLEKELNNLYDHAPYGENLDVLRRSLQYLENIKEGLSSAYRMQQAFGNAPRAPRGSIADSIRHINQVREQGRRSMKADLEQVGQDLRRMDTEACQTGKVPDNLALACKCLHNLAIRAMVLGNRKDYDSAASLWNKARKLREAYMFQYLG